MRDIRACQDAGFNSSMNASEASAAAADSIAAHMRDIRVRQDVLVHALGVVDGEDGPVQHLRLID